MRSHSPKKIGCADEVTLLAFVRGDLSMEQIESIGGHLGQCRACEEIVACLTEDVDSLASLIREAAPHGDRGNYLERVQRHLAAMDVDVTDSLVSEASGEAAGEFDADWEPPLLPMRLGRYELLEEIGQGATGIVYRARHIDLRREVAIKMLAPRQSMRRNSIERFRHELVALGRFDHPNIIRATDAGESDGRHYLVMEFARGLDLSTILGSVERLAIADACEVVRQAAVGLEFARRHGLVHRDVKPSNLLLTSAGQVKLLDFGLVLLQAPESKADRRGKVMGTADYMAPEQWLDRPDVDSRADVYSLGCTLFRLLTGHVPFAECGRDTSAKRREHLEAPVPLLSDHRREIPRDLSDLCAMMMAKRVDQRPPTPGKAARAIAPFAKGHRLEKLYWRADRPHSDTVVDAVETTAVAVASSKHRPGFRSLRSIARLGVLLLILVTGASVYHATDFGWRANILNSDWQALLNGPPPITGYDLLAPVAFDSDRQELTIQSTDRVFAELGTQSERGTSFRVYVAPEEGREAGVFFGLREPKFGDDPRERTCHTLTVKRRQGRCLVKLGYFRIHEDNLNLIVYKSDDYAFVEGEASDNADGEALEVHSNFDGTSRIVWNGRQLNVVDWTTLPGQIIDLDCLGSFGLLNCAGTTKFLRAEWKSL